MYGAILGDIIGSAFEFDHHNYKGTDFPLLDQARVFTDDTVMTVAVAHALMDWGSVPSFERGDETLSALLRLSLDYYGHLYPHAGYGGRFRAWLLGTDKRPYSSYGNGSAMRVSSAGWLFGSLEETLHAATLSAAVTHDHPEGIKGARAVAGAVYLARTGEPKERIRAFLTEEIGYALDFTLDEIRPDYRFDVSCQGSVPQAMEAFLESTDFENAVRLAVSLGGDSDTIGCMCGAVAEAFYGIPEEIARQGRSYLDEALSSQLERFRKLALPRAERRK